MGQFDSNYGDVVIPTLRIDQPANPNDTTSYPSNWNLVDIFDRSRGSVGMVIGDKTKNGQPVQATGTSFFVTGNGEAVTDYHVVQGASNLRMQTADGSTYRATVEAVDPTQDLALVKINASTTPLSLGDSTNLGQGDGVVAVGHPDGWSNEFISQGTFSDKHSLRSILSNVDGGLIQGEDPNRTLIGSNIHVENGDSGAPLMDGNGKVVGVVGMTNDSNTADSTPVEDLKRFLARNNIQMDSGYSNVASSDTGSSTSSSSFDMSSLLKAGVALSSGGGYAAISNYYSSDSSAGSQSPSAAPSLPFGLKPDNVRQAYDQAVQKSRAGGDQSPVKHKENIFVAAYEAFLKDVSEVKQYLFG